MRNFDNFNNKLLSFLMTFFTLAFSTFNTFPWMGYFYCSLLVWTTNGTHDFHDIDRVTLLKNVIANPIGRGLILNFLDRNFDILYKR